MLLTAVLAFLDVLCLLLFHRAVIIDEDKGTIVLGIGIPLGTLITWAEIT